MSDSKQNQLNQTQNQGDKQSQQAPGHKDDQHGGKQGQPGQPGQKPGQQEGQKEGQKDDQQRNR